MSGVTGSSKKIGVGITDVWGTAKELGAGDGIDSISSFDMTPQNEILSGSPIGAGNDTQKDAAVGATSPTCSLEFQPKYDGRFPQLLSLMFGHSSVPMAMGSGAYTHSIIYNATKPDVYACIAELKTTTKVFEMPSALPTNITLSADSFPSFLRCAVEMLGNKINPGDSIVNTSVTIDDVTTPTSFIITPTKGDKFLFNAQAGAALGAGDCKAITSFEIGLQVPREHVSEMKCVDENGVPRISGEYAFIPSLTITLRAADDITFFEAWRDGTEFKAKFEIIGSLIGGTQYRKFIAMFPRLKVINWPDNPISNAGENPVTITLQPLMAATAPTGMLDVLPHFLITNTTATNPVATTA